MRRKGVISYFFIEVLLFVRRYVRSFIVNFIFYVRLFFRIK